MNSFLGFSITESPSSKRAADLDPGYPHLEVEVGKNSFYINLEVFWRAYEPLYPGDASEIFVLGGISKTFFKNVIETEFSFGSFTYNVTPETFDTLPPDEYNGSYTQYVISPCLSIRKRIPSTNILIGVSLKYFHTVIRKKESYPLKGFALFIDFGAILKE